MKTKIYRVVAKDGPFISSWHTTRKACNAIIRNLKSDKLQFFGTNFKIEWEEIIIDN